MALGGGKIGEAHVSLRLTMEQYERDLRNARNSTDSATQKMALAMRRVELAAQRLTNQKQRLALQTRALDQRAREFELRQTRLAEVVNRHAVGIQRLSRQFLVLRAAAGAAIGVLGIREAAQATDAWVLMTSRLKLVTGSAEEAGVALEQLFGIAQRSRADLGATVDFYFKLANASDELGVSQAQALQVTENLNKLFKTGGVDAVRAAQASFQLSQAFAKQRLQGDELRTIHEAFPPLLRTIAEEMGTTVQALATAEGGIPIRDLLEALLRGTADIERRFGELPVTIGDALTQIRNSLIRTTGIAALTTGSFQDVTASLQDMNALINTPEFREGLGYLLQAFAAIATATTDSIAALGVIVKWLDILGDKLSGMSFQEFLGTVLSRAETSKLLDEVTGEIVERYKQLAIEGKKAAASLGEVSAELGAGAGGGGGVAEEVDEIAEAIARLQRELALEKIPEDYRGLNAIFMDLGIAATAFKDAVFLGATATEEQKQAATELFNVWQQILETKRQASLVTTVDVRSDEEANRRMRQQRAQEQLDEANKEAADQAELERIQTLIDARDLFAREVASGFTDAITGAESLGDAIAGIAQRLAEAAVQAAIFAAITAAIGAPGAGGAAGTGLFGAFGFAHGGVIQGGVKRMAHGGFITSRPMITPMQTGAALIGESGPEAVLPLKRMASGNLGVAAEGGPGGPSNVINIDARQATPGTAAAAVREAVRLAPGAIVNAQARGQMGRQKAPF